VTVNVKIPRTCHCYSALVDILMQPGSTHKVQMAALKTALAVSTKNRAREFLAYFM